jgi:hypothetical protein
MQTRNPAHESDAISKLDGTPLSRQREMTSDFPKARDLNLIKV